MKKENIYTDEELYWMTGGDAGTLPTRIIPSEIYSLAPNEVFVFGSNALGMHHGGAARVAYNEFGAEWGNGEGLQGQSYAIPTMEVSGDSHRMWNSGLLTRRDSPYVQGDGSTRERISTHQLLEGADEQQRK